MPADTVNTHDKPLLFCTQCVCMRVHYYKSNENESTEHKVILFLHSKCTDKRSWHLLVCYRILRSNWILLIDCCICHRAVKSKQTYCFDEEISWNGIVCVWRNCVQMTSHLISAIHTITFHKQTENVSAFKFWIFWIECGLIWGGNCKHFKPRIHKLVQ